MQADRLSWAAGQADRDPAVDAVLDDQRGRLGASVHRERRQAVVSSAMMHPSGEATLDLPAANPERGPPPWPGQDRGEPPGSPAARRKAGGTTTRLDGFIDRLHAQRAWLDHAAELVADRPGIVLELGLGNGRTYHHLRTLLPAHRMLVFERTLHPHPMARPPLEDLVVGDLSLTLGDAIGAHIGKIVLVHADLGSADVAVDDALAALVARVLPPSLDPHAIVLSDQRLEHAKFARQVDRRLDPADRYYAYRVQP